MASCYSDSVNNDEQEGCTSRTDGQIILSNVFNAPQIIKRIFSCLNAPEILHMQRVCKNWQKYGRLTLGNRRKIVPLAGINKELDGTRPCCLLDFRIQMQDFDSVPALGIIFSRFPATSCLTNFHIPCSLRSSLPSTCKLVGGVCSEGLYAGSCGPCKKAMNNNHALGRKEDGVSGFLLPSALLERPDVHVSTFSIKRSQSDMLEDLKKDRETFCKTFGWPEKYELKCIIILSPTSSFGEPVAAFCDWVAALPEGPDIALCGGVVQIIKETHPVREEGVVSKDVDLIGIMFGGPGVHASSFIMRPEVKGSSVARLLGDWKSNVMDQWPESDDRIAFLFRCSGRLSSVNEATIFNQIFPDVPICGLKSHGEYGKDVPKVLAKVENLKRKRTNAGLDDEVPMSFRAAFALIAFDKI